MKEIKKGVLVFVCALLLTGCVKSHTTIDIKNDKSMNFSMDFLLANQLVETQGSAIFDSMNKKEFEKKNITVTDVKEEKYTGVKLEKKYDNIDKISSSNKKEVVISNFMDASFDDSALFKVEKGFLKNKYTATFKYEAASQDSLGMNDTDNSDVLISEDENEENLIGTSENEQMTAEEKELMEALASEMEYKFIVNLPNKNISNNATTVDKDGKTLTWNLLTEGASDINFAFELYNLTTIYIIGGGVLLVILIVIVLLILKKKKNAVDVIPTEGPIHTDFDPSIAPKVEENSQPTNMTAPEQSEVPTENVETPVAPTEIPVEQPVIQPVEVPMIEVPVVETAPAVAVEVEQPQAIPNYEFTLPEEKAAVEAQVELEANPVEKKPMFITDVPVEPEEPVAPVNEVKIETPDIVDMNNTNN